MRSIHVFDIDSILYSVKNFVHFCSIDIYIILNLHPVIIMVTFYGKTYTNAYALNAQKLTANERIANAF